MTTIILITVLIGTYLLGKYALSLGIKNQNKELLKNMNKLKQKETKDYGVTKNRGLSEP